MHRAFENAHVTYCVELTSPRSPLFRPVNNHLVRDILLVYFITWNNDNSFSSNNTEPANHSNKVNNHEVTTVTIFYQLTTKRTVKISWLLKYTLFLSALANLRKTEMSSNLKVYIGWQWRNFVSYLCQLVFAAILWEKLLEMFVTVMSHKYALSV